MFSSIPEKNHNFQTPLFDLLNHIMFLEGVVLHEFYNKFAELFPLSWNMFEKLQFVHKSCTSVSAHIETFCFPLFLWVFWTRNQIFPVSYPWLRTLFYRAVYRVHLDSLVCIYESIYVTPFILQQSVKEFHLIIDILHILHNCAYFQKTGEKGEFSCGWVHVPLYDEATGAPILNK